MSIQDQYLPKKEDYEQLQETFDTFLKVKKIMCSSADVFSRFSVHYSSSLNGEITIYYKENDITLCYYPKEHKYKMVVSSFSANSEFYSVFNLLKGMFDISVEKKETYEMRGYYKGMKNTETTYALVLKENKDAE